VTWPCPFFMPIFENFLQGHVWTVPGNMHVKYEVRSFNRFAFNTQKFRGSCDPGYARFSKNFYGVISGLSLKIRTPNLKSAALTVLELLAFNAQTGLIDRSAAHRHTHIERKWYLCHSLHSLGGDNNNSEKRYKQSQVSQEFSKMTKGLLSEQLTNFVW